MMDTYIPGDCLPGLIVGWVGPCECYYEKWHSAIIGNGHLFATAVFGDVPIRLDTRRGEVRDRVARVAGKILHIKIGSTSPAFYRMKSPAIPLQWRLGCGAVFSSRVYEKGQGWHYVPELTDVPERCAQVVRERIEAADERGINGIRGQRETIDRLKAELAARPLFHCPSCGHNVLPEWLTDIVYVGCPAWKCPHCETVWYFEFVEES
jgi:hypothetical protein